MTELTPLSGPLMPGDAAMADRLREFVQDREAFSDNTWRQLLSVMRTGSRWADEHGRRFLPMTPADLRDYLLWLQATGRASSTITTHAALISMLHRNAGLTPPNRSPMVFRAVKRINRTAVISGERAGQAVPFRIGDLLTLDKRWCDSDRLQQLRDLAFLHVAYATLLRVSELGRLRVRDISRAPDGRIVLDVAWTKTIVMTGGLIKGLGDLSSQRLTAWLSASGLIAEPDAYIFGPVHRTNRALLSTEKPLTTRALEDIFARAWQEGTWKKAETVMRYIRHVDAHAGAMVDLMDRSGQ